MDPSQQQHQMMLQQQQQLMMMMQFGAQPANNVNGQNPSNININVNAVNNNPHQQAMLQFQQSQQLQGQQGQGQGQGQGPPLTGQGGVGVGVGPGQGGPVGPGPGGPGSVPLPLGPNGVGVPSGPGQSNNINMNNNNVNNIPMGHGTGSPQDQYMQHFYQQQQLNHQQGLVHSHMGGYGQGQGGQGSVGVGYGMGQQLHPHMDPNDPNSIISMNMNMSMNNNNQLMNQVLNHQGQGQVLQLPIEEEPFDEEANAAALEARRLQEEREAAELRAHAKRDLSLELKELRRDVNENLDGGEAASRNANNRILRKRMKLDEPKQKAFILKHMDRFRPFLTVKVRRLFEQVPKDEDGAEDDDLHEAPIVNAALEDEDDNNPQHNAEDKELLEPSIPEPQGPLVLPEAITTSAASSSRDSWISDCKVWLDKQPDCIDKSSGEMRSYQLEGLNWMISRHDNGVPGILGDEMGLGKTLQTIAFLGYLKFVRGIHGPHLVVAPLSVLSPWMNEFRRWCPSLRAVRYHGPSGERRRLAREEARYGNFDVIVTTYEMVTSEDDFFRYKYMWNYLIVDEAHQVKNENALRSQSLSAIPRTNTLLLTGTPTQNNMHELWSLVHFLFPKLFVSSHPFDRAFDLARHHVDADMLTAAHELLKPIMLRRIKSDIETKLPPKTETKIFVQLSPMQTYFYKKLLQRDLDILAEPESGQKLTALEAAAKAEQTKLEAKWLKGFQENVKREDKGFNSASDDAVFKRLMSLMMQLRKLCNHPYVFLGAEINFDEEEELQIKQEQQRLLQTKTSPPIEQNISYNMNYNNSMINNNDFQNNNPVNQFVNNSFNGMEMNLNNLNQIPNDGTNILPNPANMESLPNESSNNNNNNNNTNSNDSNNDNTTNPNSNENSIEGNNGELEEPVPKYLPPPPKVKVETSDERAMRHLISGSGKLAVLDKLLAKLFAEKHRVLLFSLSTKMMDILEDYLKFRTFQYARLDGSTNRVRRTIDTKRFNSPGSPLFIYLISTRAGGLGINLATADTVIHYDSDFNPQVDLQAQDRAHRIGQTKPVHVYRFVTEGTVEERLIARAEKKLYLHTMVTRQGRGKKGVNGDEDDLAKMSKSEVLGMLMFGADRIFRASHFDDGSLKDIDIDVILQRSQQLTSQDKSRAQVEASQELFQEHHHHPLGHLQHHPNLNHNQLQVLQQQQLALSQHNLNFQHNPNLNMMGMNNYPHDHMNMNPHLMALNHNPHQMMQENSQYAASSFTFGNEMGIREFGGINYEKHSARRKRLRWAQPDTNNVVEGKRKRAPSAFGIEFSDIDIAEQERALAAANKRRSTQEKKIEEKPDRALAAALKASAAEAAAKAAAEEAERLKAEAEKFELKWKYSKRNPYIRCSTVRIKFEGNEVVEDYDILHYGHPPTYDEEGKRIKNNTWFDAPTTVPVILTKKKIFLNKSSSSRLKRLTNYKPGSNRTRGAPAGDDAGYTHEDWCHLCKTGGELVCCTWCPRTFHKPCLGINSLPRSFFSCPQHTCATCDRKANEAGGLLFRCIVCPCSFCEDHLPPESSGRRDVDFYEQFAKLGYKQPASAYYVVCSWSCLQYYQEYKRNAGQEDSDDELEESTAHHRPLSPTRAAHAKEVENHLLAQTVPKGYKDHECGCLLPKKDKARLYCLCRAPYDESKFMIMCDECKEWYHGKCVGVRPGDFGEDEPYVCELCSQKQARKSFSTATETYNVAEDVEHEKDLSSSSGSEVDSNAEEEEEHSEEPEEEDEEGDEEDAVRLGIASTKYDEDRGKKKSKLPKKVNAGLLMGRDAELQQLCIHLPPQHHKQVYEFAAAYPTASTAEICNLIIQQQQQVAAQQIDMNGLLAQHQRELQHLYSEEQRESQLPQIANDPEILQRLRTFYQQQRVELQSRHQLQINQANLLQQQQQQSAGQLQAQIQSALVQAQAAIQQSQLQALQSGVPMPLAGQSMVQGFNFGQNGANYEEDEEEDVSSRGSDSDSDSEDEEDDDYDEDDDEIAGIKRPKATRSKKGQMRK